MKVIQQTITPKAAEFLLLGNTRNRPLNDEHVRILMREMQGGRWKVNGDAIRINGNGTRLIDGQHRLEACRRSGIPFTTLVVSELDDTVFDTIDCGRRRGASDTLALRGEKSAVRLAGSLQVVDKYMTGRLAGCVRYTNTEVEMLLEKYPGVRESVNGCVSITNRLLPFSVMAGCHYLFSQLDPEKADLVVRQVARGTDLEAHNPMYVLRERLMQNSISKAKLPPYYLMALFIKAWNAMRESRGISLLRYLDGESFPVVR